MAGNAATVQKLCERSRGSMNEILNLVNPKALEEVAETELAQLTEMREKPLPGEKEHIWAIESLESASRQRLPKWMAQPIEKAVLLWGEEKRKWEKELFERGGSLPKAKREAYQEWTSSGQKVKMLFNKKAEKLVNKLRANVSMKNVTTNFLSVEISMDADPGNLTIKSGSNNPWKLMLLEGDPFDGVEEVGCPAALDGGVDPSLLEELKSKDQEEQEEANDDVDPLVQAALDEQNELLEADQAIEDDGVDDPFEVMALSDDEAVSAHVLGAVKRVKQFNHRAAYVELDSEGLVMLPSHHPGLYLSFHSTSSTWQGFYPNCHSGLSYTFSKTTGRALIWFHAGTF